MVTFKSHVKRRFKPDQFPENVCFDSNEVDSKFDKSVLNAGEEVLITVDNEPTSDQADGVIFTPERLVVFTQGSVRSVPWEQIESYQLPKEKKEMIILAMIIKWRAMIK